MPVERYVVTIDRPATMTSEDMEQYLTDAVRSHKGGFDRTDPMFCHPMRGLTVRREIRRPRQEIPEATPWGTVALAHFPKPTDKKE
jgi:hypothetical protein